MSSETHITNPDLIQILKYISIMKGCDCDGDIIYLQGHKYFVHLMKDIYQEIDPQDHTYPLSTTAWVWVNKNKSNPIIIFGETKQDVNRVIFDHIPQLEMYGFHNLPVKIIDLKKVYDQVMSRKKKSFLSGLVGFFRNEKNSRRCPLFFR